MSSNTKIGLPTFKLSQLSSVNFTEEGAKEAFKIQFCSMLDTPYEDDGNTIVIGIKEKIPNKEDYLFSICRVSLEKLENNNSVVLILPNLLSGDFRFKNLKNIVLNPTRDLILNGCKDE